MKTLPTPRLEIDGPIVRENIRRMAEYGATHNLSIRPHTKTHKSQRIARMQLAAGAGGLTVAKLGEAEVMAEVSVDILVAYPALDPIRATGIANLAKRITVHVAVDSRYAVDALAAATQTVGSTIGILVDIDVGMGRTGLQTPRQALELAQNVETTKGVRLDGIMCYPGHVWGDPDKQSDQLSRVSDKLAETLALWHSHGLEAGIVSGGSTPTAYQSHLISELTEIRPGTYVFNDMNEVRGGYATVEECAARMVCTVVSNAVPGQVVIDAGNKTLTSDRCLPALESGYGYVVEYPDATITALSEEHGQVDISRCRRSPQLGEQIHVIPNHICPCVNLHDTVWWVEPDREPEQMRVDARGRVV